MLTQSVKLVIWDLDDTFWNGTLAEGEITPIEANHRILVTLAERGIISAIASKNDYSQAAARLTELGVWAYFVFPKIEFAPKGENIGAIIETAGLRPENVLFIDDNKHNLEEARHLSPGLMTAGPEILGTLLDYPQCLGKDDKGLTRLEQYKNLEVKAAERTSTALSQEDFLRQCAITVEIDHDLEKYFDRVIELANRTNQLNFTKVRLEKKEALAKFQRLITSFGVTAGVVQVSDRYGDYGIVGYFVLQRTASRNELKHFVFSCRTMNMGIEQYVFEKLKKPSIEVIKPVANEISPFQVVDWINEGVGDGAALRGTTPAKKLLLLGGCELLQLSALCSANRAEYVNTIRDDIVVRFDEPSFVLTSRRAIKNDLPFAKLRQWTYEDAIGFDLALAETEILITALVRYLSLRDFESSAGNRFSFGPNVLRRLATEDPDWFAANFRLIKLSDGQKLAVLADCLAQMAYLTPPGCRRFALGANTKKPGAEQLTIAGWPDCLRNDRNQQAWIRALNSLPRDQKELGRRHIFNRFLQDYCERHKTYTFVDVDALVRWEDLPKPNKVTGAILPDHFNRRGHIAIAQFIQSALQEQADAAPFSGQRGPRLDGAVRPAKIFSNPKYDSAHLMAELRAGKHQVR